MLRPCLVDILDGANITEIFIS